MCEARPPRTVLNRRDALAAGGLALATFGVRAGRGTRRGTPPKGLEVEVAPGLFVRRREAWGADLPPKPGLIAEDVKFLLVHHTAGRNDDTVDEVPGTLRFVYSFHTGPEKGWPDVCYNFFIDPYGVVWEGRAGSLDGPVMADATGGSQGFAQLVCLLGDFTKVMPTVAALDSLTRTLAWLAGRYGIATGPDETVTFTSRGSNRWPAGATVTATTVSGHRDMSSTACPGDTFYPYVHETLPALIHQLTLVGAGPTTSNSPTSEPLPPTPTPDSGAPTTTTPALGQDAASTTDGEATSTVQSVAETTSSELAATTPITANAVPSEQNTADAGPASISMSPAPTSDDSPATGYLVGGGAAVVAAGAAAAWLVRRGSDGRPAP